MWVQKLYAGLQRRIDTAYEDKLDGQLSPASFQEKANGWHQDMAHIRSDLSRHENADRAYTEEGIALLELASMALELYESQDAPEKRRLLDFLCLNTEFRGDTLVVKWKKPFDGIVQSIQAVNTKGVAFDEKSDAHQVWLREATRSRNWFGQDSGLDLRLQRLLTWQRELLPAKSATPRAKTSVLARAMEWQAMLRRPGIGNRAGLAASLGVSRARITQGMAVLSAPDEVLAAIRRIESEGRVVTQSLWLRVAKLSTADALNALRLAAATPA